MYIIGFLGSPRTNGSGAKMLQKLLEGAESRGAVTKKYELINCDIDFCRSCFNCVFTNHDLPVGTCPLKDDMAAILEQYVTADGYVFTTPNYDGSVTALMKRFLERKIALTYRDREAYATIMSARSPAEFRKKASMIVTANCPDEYREVMGDPCFEHMEGHLMIEQVETVDKIYVGGVENISDAAFSEKLQEAFNAGARLVDEIAEAQKES